ncbi:MAG TPA: hypothetical protein VG369_07890, partial [Humibacter sp.]|nr:hypothetical protein [Humibacter sp.]
MPVPTPLPWPADTNFAALADAGWPAIERTAVEGTDAGGTGVEHTGVERTDAGGWVARFATGVTQRANSVYPTGRVNDVGSAIDAAERLYRARSLPPLFQVSGEDDALGEALVARGYAPRNETIVLAANLVTLVRALGSHEPSTERVVVTDTLDDEWLDVWWSVDGRGGTAQRGVARSILTGGPALYATVRDEEGAASVGRLALVEQRGVLWGGLFALATRPDARRNGHALAVIDALARAAAERGVA